MEILIIICILIVLAISLSIMAIYYYLRKGINFVKRMFNGEMSEEEFERLSKKFSKHNAFEGAHFDKDYFKGAQQSQKQQTTQKRTVKSDDGVTIVDHRTQEQTDKKIFAHDEGEYVDYTEV